MNTQHALHDATQGTAPCHACLPTMCEAPDTALPALPGHVRSRRHWVAPPPRPFRRSERAGTTVLLGGLTPNHDALIAGALRGLGYRIAVLPQPDNDALELGKAYCNRGMCNPTYYTVGNLLRFLDRVRSEQGLSHAEVADRYALLTANGCGPCRFSLYGDEYRRALRDSGYEGFRVLATEQLFGGATLSDGLETDARFYYRAAQGLLLGDLLNVLTCRLRPYEREPGATERVMARARQRLARVLEMRSALAPALRAVRRDVATIALDLTCARPKVAIIGEFWASLTHGDGSYRLPAFLEAEGAEVEIQPLAAWLLLLLWERRYDASGLAGLAPADRRHATRREGHVRTLLAVKVLEWLVRLHFRRYARLIGLRGYCLPNCDRLAAMTHPLYDVNQRGGEDFFEVAKTLDCFGKRKAHLVVSVKPFGCMPSSGVSDGVQSLVLERYPHASFLPIETTGDGAANIYSRVQMQLFRAKEIARQELREALEKGGASLRDAQALLSAASWRVLSVARGVNHVPTTAANLLLALQGGGAWYRRLLARWHVRAAVRRRHRPPGLSHEPTPAAPGDTAPLPAGRGPCTV